MKYAFASFSAPEATLADLLALARRAGYDAIEPRIGANHGHGVELAATPEGRRTLREAAAAGGVALCCLAAPYRYTDPATSGARVDETRRAIDLAADVGAPLVRVFAGEIPTGMSREDATARVADALRAAAPHAAALGVTLCVETHDDWSDPRHMAVLLRHVDHPAIACCWDVMHTQRLGGMAMDDAYAALVPWVRHVHIHDGPADPADKRFVPIGTGALDHRRVVDLLGAAGYGGYLSGEWLASWMPDWPPAEVYLPRELATMRAYEREAEATA